MSEIAAPDEATPWPKRSVGAIAWLIFMEGMWAAFFALLLTDRLPSVYDAVRDLPFAAELAAWVVGLPWMLSAAVWTSGSAGWLRLLAVMAFAIGWTLVSLPRKTPAS